MGTTPDGEAERQRETLLMCMRMSLQVRERWLPVFEGCAGAIREEIEDFRREIWRVQGIDPDERSLRYRFSREWEIKRQAMLWIADFHCQLCNASTKQARLDVHHRTYDREGRERPGDLIVLCDECHEWHHRRFTQAPKGRES